MSNPLDGFYRTKEIYVKLPTQGRWYTDPPNLTDAGEIGIYPMTMRDEMLLSVPDALYNGESLFELFASICPDIKDPYELCSPDVDVLLLAAKAATYDNKLAVTSQCSKCKEQNTYEIDLASVLSKIKVIDDVTSLDINGLSIVFKPNTLAVVNAQAIKNAETAKMIREMGDSTFDDEKRSDQFRESLARTTAANMAILADSILTITTPDNVVVKNIDHIIEWLTNSERAVVDKLLKFAGELNQNGIQNEFNFKCANVECEDEFTAPVEFNPSFFFKSG
tara:strand:- start:9002 stop:9838 length:837 start_codon:yes stop_codon:yes gene_type:complete